jgi:hypothetical protein
MTKLRALVNVPCFGLFCALAACGDEAAATSSGAGGGATTSSSSADGGASSSTSASVGASGSGGGIPTCGATFADSVRVTTVDIAGASGARAVTSQAGTGSVVAWSSGDGSIHVTRLDPGDQRAADDFTIPGDQVFGVAASASEVALLISRSPDFMTFQRVDLNGTTLAKSDLVGGGDHAVEGVEWFYEFAQTGRLVGRGDGTYAAYHALHRRWPDGIGHQGDTLRILDAGGLPIGGGWGWGCSHSMDQRLAFDPAVGLVPVCIADCYPGKGIYFDHDVQLITDDPGANCAGGFSTLLGGLVATSTGYFVVYQDDQGGAHLGAFAAGGAPVSDRTLDVAGSSRLGKLGTGMVLGASGGSGAQLRVLDAAGVETGVTADVPVALPDQDFESRSDGTVAWATASGTTLTVVRVPSCP